MAVVLNLGADKDSWLFEAERDPDLFKQDLWFVKEKILHNHPGVYNLLDQDFLSRMKKSYTIAMEQLFESQSEEQKSQIVENFGKSFEDSHLQVRYKSAKTALEVHRREFGIQPLKEDVYWISVPTFKPGKNEVEVLKKMIEKLSGLREKTVIFDLRGNGGGNSFWAEEILMSLFGKQYVKFGLSKYNQNVEVEWRATEENLMHLKKLIADLKSEFPAGHESLLELEECYKEMKKALELRKEYSLQKQVEDKEFLQKDVPSLFKGKILLVVDKECKSACLDFIDALNIMHPNVVLFGETTGADSCYMEIRVEELPSKKGLFCFPIKVYRNRVRGHNIPYVPDILYEGNLKDTSALQEFILTKKINL